MIYQQTFTFKKNKLQKSNDVKIIPCKVSSTNSINNYQPTPAKGKAKKRILAKMNRYCKPFNVHFKKNGQGGAVAPPCITYFRLKIPDCLH